MSESTQKLTPKERRFVSEYLVDFNATRAHRASGYKAKSENSRRALASKKVAKGNIKTAIQEGINKLNERSDKARAQLVSFYFLVISTPITDFMECGVTEGKSNNVLIVKNFQQIPQHLRVLIKKVKETKDGVEIELYDKLAAAKALREMHGFDAPERRTLLGDRENPLVVEHKNKLDLSKLTDDQLDTALELARSLGFSESEPGEETT